MVEPRKCGDCRHWFGGECRCFPPQIVPMPGDNQHPVIYWPTPMYPGVGAEQPACGEFKELYI